jgi:hypothetical protein
MKGDFVKANKSVICDIVHDVGGVELEDWENGLPCGDDNIDLV